MTNQELFNRAESEMKSAYTSGIRCLSTSKGKKQARFFRDFTEGQIDGIYTLTVQMYLDLIYNRDAENQEAESNAYTRFCRQIRERANELRDLLIQYASRYI